MGYVKNGIRIVSSVEMGAVWSIRVRERGRMRVFY